MNFLAFDFPFASNFSTTFDFLTASNFPIAFDYSFVFKFLFAFNFPIFGKTLRFENPGWLWMILALALIILQRHLFYRPGALAFADLTSIRSGLPRSWASTIRKILPWGYYFALLLMIIALARPQSGVEETRIPTEGISIAVCLDRSGSMQAMDFQINDRPADRLEAVKTVFRDFVLGKDNILETDNVFGKNSPFDKDQLSGRPNDQMGLLVFGGFVDGISPLTLDHEALLEMLSLVELPKPVLDSYGRQISHPVINEESATAIGDALVQAVTLLEKSKDKTKIVILLSDGAQTAGVVSPEEAAQFAKDKKIKVYTIGIGTTGIAPFPVRGNDGRIIGYERGVVELDEQTLRSIAKTTGGKYFNAKDTQALKNVYQEIDQLEKTKHEGHRYTTWKDLYLSFLLPAVGLILTVFVLQQTRFRALP